MDQRRTPSLSDEAMGHTMGRIAVREHYEKTWGPLIQRLVNTLEYVDREIGTIKEVQEGLALAKANDFEPTFNTEEE